MKKPIYVPKGIDARQLSDWVISSQSGFFLSSPVCPDRLSHVVLETLTEIRALMQDVIAATKDGQKRTDDLTSAGLTTKQAAAYLNVSTATIERLAAAGKLRCSAVPNGRGKGERAMRRFKREWLDEFLVAACPPPPSPPPPPPATPRKRSVKPFGNHIK